MRVCLARRRLLILLVYTVWTSAARRPPTPARSRSRKSARNWCVLGMLCLRCVGCSWRAASRLSHSLQSPDGCRVAACVGFGCCFAGVVRPRAHACFGQDGADDSRAAARPGRGCRLGERERWQQRSGKQRRWASGGGWWSAERRCDWQCVRRASFAGVMQGWGGGTGDTHVENWFHCRTDSARQSNSVCTDNSRRTLNFWRTSRLGSLDT